MKYKTVIIVLIVLIIQGYNSECIESEDQTAHRQVIFISIDTLRADYLGCYGHIKGVSPNIDNFAEQATLFRHCTSQAPYTIGSFLSVFSSRFPSEILSAKRAVNHDISLLPELLQKSGLYTVAVISNPKLSARSGLKRGFDRYEELFRKLIQSKKVKISAEMVNAKVKVMLEDLKDRDFFLWLLYFDPHTPYIRHADRFYDHDHSAVAGTAEGKPIYILSREEARKARLEHMNPTWFTGIASNSYATPEHKGIISDLYRAEIGFLDEALGNLFQILKQAGVYDNALIILTADHGESIFDHQNYYGHGEFPYQATVHVPLIIRWPNATPSVCSVPVALLDITPTILNKIGTKYNGTLRGAILSPDGRTGEAPIFVETQKSRHRSIRQDSYKLIEWGDDRANPYSLFDLSVDQNEHNDLAKSKPEKVKELSDKIKTISPLLHFSGKEMKRPDVDQETLDQIRALGYTD